MTTAPVSAPNPFKIGMTLKAASGYEAEWLTPSVYGGTADETAQRAVDLIKALADRGVIEMVSHAAVKMRDTHQAPAGRGGGSPKFQNGRVQTQQQDQAPAGAAGVAGDNCPHGRTHRTGSSAKGPWEAMFCSAPQKHQQCKALFLQKDGSWT
ncbi:hypothetical protein [Streptomyces sp. NPDC059874]|uniref:hypothetical protein n=1 Tax=Streptomyces sp. NPDC059874 TaxID=3346983 RepID=UPI0036597F03